MRLDTPAWPQHSAPSVTTGTKLEGGSGKWQHNMFNMCVRNPFCSLDTKSKQSVLCKCVKEPYNLDISR